MATVWSMRAKPDGIDRLPEFLAGEYVAVGWHELRDLSNHGPASIRDALEQDCPLRAQERSRDVTLLDQFVNVLDDGDLLLVPSVELRGVHLAVAIGSYRFVPGNRSVGSRHLPHRRDVRWLDDARLIAPEALPAEALLKWRHYQQMISPIDVEPSEILRLVAIDDRNLGRIVGRGRRGRRHRGRTAHRRPITPPTRGEAPRG